MSTRSQLRFQRLSDDDHGPIAQLYRHSDGYPEAVLPALQRLQLVLRTTRSERGPSYTAATFVHVEKCRAMQFSLGRGPGGSITGTTREDVLDVRSWVALEQPGFLMGYGVEDPAHGIHGDEEYLYVVELPEADFVNPQETGDWHVKVSDHCGFPRWDGPTDRAFESANWQYEGPLGEATEALGIEPGRATDIDGAERAGR